MSEVDLEWCSEGDVNVLIDSEINVELHERGGRGDALSAPPHAERKSGFSRPHTLRARRKLESKLEDKSAH